MLRPYITTLQDAVPHPPPLPLSPLLPQPQRRSLAPAPRSHVAARGSARRYALPRATSGSSRPFSPLPSVSPTRAAHTADEPPRYLGPIDRSSLQVETTGSPRTKSAHDSLAQRVSTPP